RVVGLDAGAGDAETRRIAEVDPEPGEVRRDHRGHRRVEELDARRDGGAAAGQRVHAVDAAVVRVGVAVVALLVAVHHAVAAGGYLAVVQAAVGVEEVSVVALLDTGFHVAVAADGRLARRGAGIGVVGVAIVARLAELEHAVPARRRAAVNRAGEHAARRDRRVADAPGQIRAAPHGGGVDPPARLLELPHLVCEAAAGFLQARRIDRREGGAALIDRFLAGRGVADHVPHDLRPHTADRVLAGPRRLLR